MLLRGNSDIPTGSVILVTGVEGALKSGLVFNMMSNYLADNNEHGIYATLEKTEECHLRDMADLGIKKLERLHVFDYMDIIGEWENEKPDLFKVTEDMIDFYKEKYKPLTVFALDPLNALYSVSNHVNLRKNMYRFFTMLRDKDLTSFLILETCSPEKHVMVCSDDSLERPEYFLADGIIELGIIEDKENVKNDYRIRNYSRQPGIIEDKENVKRYIQIRKMRGANHSMEKHQIVVEKDGIHVFGSVY